MGLGFAGTVSMRLHLGGHLNYFDALKRADLEIELSGKEHLRDVLALLKIPAGEVFIISINGEVVSLDDAWIRPNDYVMLYPPMGGG
jgi:sulfur carrier protein ThiS